MVMRPEPASGKFLRRLYGLVQVLLQPVITDGAVVSLRANVLLRLARLDVSSRIRRRSAQAVSAAPMYSGPLSQRIVTGFPHHSMICSSVRITRSAGSEKSTSMPSPFRSKSSIMLNSQKARPSSKRSCMKSIDQTSLIAPGTANGSGFSRTRRFLYLMRRFSSSAR